MKRSTTMRTVTIGLLGGSAFALAACQEEVTMSSFPDVGSCVAAAENDPALGLTADLCTQDFLLAQAEHDRTAPRYDAMDVCEAEHGPEACVQASDGGGGSIIMPLLAGYMIGSMLSNGARGGYAAQPLVKNAAGGYSPTNGSALIRSFGTGAKVSPGVFNPAATTKGLAPMTKATVSARGGFGGARTGGGISSGG